MDHLNVLGITLCLRCQCVNYKGSRCRSPGTEVPYVGVLSWLLSGCLEMPAKFTSVRLARHKDFIIKHPHDLGAQVALNIVQQSNSCLNMIKGYYFVVPQFSVNRGNNRIAATGYIYIYIFTHCS